MTRPPATLDLPVAIDEAALPPAASAGDTLALSPLAVGASVDIPYGRFLVVAVPAVIGRKKPVAAGDTDWADQCAADVVQVGEPLEPENANLALAAKLDALLRGERPFAIKPWTMVSSPFGLLRVISPEEARLTMAGSGALPDMQWPATRDATGNWLAGAAARLGISKAAPHEHRFGPMQMPDGAFVCLTCGAIQEKPDAS